MKRVSSAIIDKGGTAIGELIALYSVKGDFFNAPLGASKTHIFFICNKIQESE